MAVPLFQTVPEPDRDVVDRISRDQAALVLRRFAAGQITNDDFESGMPVTADPAIGAIWDTVWLYYSDTRTHLLTGPDRLHADAKRMWIRWLLFLDPELPYEWPQVSQPGNDPVARSETTSTSWLRSIFIKEKQVAAHKSFELAGDYAVWPFTSRTDYRAALKVPRRLTAKN